MPLDQYLTLGRSGLRVSPFALGAMTFGDDAGGAGSSVEESEKILATYLDRGGNFVDTANFYTNGHSEKILGDWFAANPAQRDRVVLASKFFANMYPGDPNGGGAGRSSIRRQLHETLRRLQTDHLDLYWLHNWDRHTPIEETLRALDDLVTRRHDSLHRILEHPRLGHRAGTDDGRAARVDSADRIAGGVLASGAHRGRRTRAAGARPGHGAGAVESAAQRLPFRQVPPRRRSRRFRSGGLCRRTQRRGVRRDRSRRRHRR